MTKVPGSHNDPNLHHASMKKGNLIRPSDRTKSEPIPFKSDDKVEEKTLPKWALVPGLSVEHEEDDPCTKLQEENEKLKKENDELKNRNGETAPDPVPTERPAPPKPVKKPVNKPVNKPIDKPVSGPNEEPKVKTLTNKEVRAASSNGKRVADLLIGYTTDNDQATVKEVIEDRVNEDNVVEFLRGYDFEQRKSADTWIGVKGDKFFEQMYRESDFADKGEIMMDVAQKLSQYCENHGMYESADRLNDLIQKFETHQFTQTDVMSIVKNMDKVVQNLIKF